MSSTATSKTTTDQQAIAALLELSGFDAQREYDNVKRMEAVIRKAPDPETACQVITEQFQTSGALTDKWRDIIHKTWVKQHPGAACGLDLPITTQEVARIPALMDARGLLKELAARPAKVEEGKNDRSISSDELSRLMQAMPSLRSSIVVPEDEWGVMPLRRLRDVLIALGLLRVYQGHLQVVQSRYARWDRLSLPQQFYALWHADVYHVPWSNYAGMWGRYFGLMQNYLPLLWEISDDVFPGRRDLTAELSQTCVEIFYPLWEQEGLLNSPSNKRTFYDVYEQSALPGVMEHMVVNDIFGRYGLVESLVEQLSIFEAAGVTAQIPNSLDHVRWTDVGEILIESEREEDLPCAVEALR